VTGTKRRGRPPKPFDRAELTITLRDLPGRGKLHKLVVAADLSEREEAVFLTVVLSAHYPWLVNADSPARLSQAAVAVLQGLSPQYVNQLWQSACAKIVQAADDKPDVVRDALRHPTDHPGWAASDYLRTWNPETDDFDGSW
jgi:hypothetical protein